MVHAHPPDRPPTPAFVKGEDDVGPVHPSIVVTGRIRASVKDLRRAARAAGLLPVDEALDLGEPVQPWAPFVDAMSEALLALAEMVSDHSARVENVTTTIQGAVSENLSAVTETGADDMVEWISVHFESLVVTRVRNLLAVFVAAGLACVVIGGALGVTAEWWFRPDPVAAFCLHGELTVERPSGRRYCAVWLDPAPATKETRR